MPIWFLNFGREENPFREGGSPFSGKILCKGPGACRRGVNHRQLRVLMLKNLK